MTERKVSRHSLKPVSFILLSLFLLTSLRPVLSFADEAPSSPQVDTAETLATQTEEKESLSADELLKSKAGQLFITRQYEPALTEFQILSAQYPKDLAIRRYIGACLFQLKRDDQAIEAFQKILEMDSYDFPSRQFLAKIYLKEGDIEKAEAEFNFIVQNDQAGTFVTFAKSQLEVIRRLKESAKSVTGEVGRQISLEQFLKTKAATRLASADYSSALVELEGLEREYPGDILIKRYKGLALDKLRRHEEAVKVYESGLAIVPDNVALHYFGAQAYFHLKNYDKAKQELEFVVANDPTGGYRAKAQADLKAVVQMIEYLKRPKPKRWSGNFSIGQEYDTNATSESRFTPSISEEHTFRMPVSFNFNYDLMKSGPWSTRFSYSHYDSFYWSVEHLNVLAHTFSLSTTYIGKVAGKYLITQISPAFSHATVDRKYYSSSYPLSLTLIYSYWDWHRVIFTERFTIADYKNEGTNPTDTSREGISNSIELTNNFYFDKEKKSYFQVVYGAGVDEPVGSQYVKNYYTLTGGIYAPLMGNTSGSLKLKFKESDYPETNAAIQRHDEEYVLSGSINIPINDLWVLSPFYSYTNVNSTDNIFTYINHAGGANLTYSF